MALRLKCSLLAAAASTALALAAAPAQAAGDFGSAVLVTARDCGDTPSTSPCAGPATTLNYQAFAGGPGQGVDFFAGDLASSYAQSEVTFGVGALPVIRQSDAAVTNSRLNVNTFAYNSFVYGGDAPIELSYAGALHFVDSSGAPLGDYGSAGGAGFFGWVAIWDPSLVIGFNTAADAFTGSSYGARDCSTPGVLAYGEANGGLSGGEQSFSMSTISCSGSPVMISPGQEVLAVAFLQTPVNRGGYADASQTFRVSYDPDLPAEVRETLFASMAPGAPAVPEPSTWAMMILGLGLVGVMARRRGVVHA